MEEYSHKGGASLEREVEDILRACGFNPKRDVRLRVGSATTEYDVWGEAETPEGKAVIVCECKQKEIENAAISLNQLEAFAMKVRHATAASGLPESAVAGLFVTNGRATKEQQGYGRDNRVTVWDSANLQKARQTLMGNLSKEEKQNWLLKEVVVMAEPSFIQRTIQFWTTDFTQTKLALLGVIIILAVALLWGLYASGLLAQIVLILVVGVFLGVLARVNASNNEKRHKHHKQHSNDKGRPIVININK